MQKSLTTSRMQSSCWVNYDRPVSMTISRQMAGTCARRFNSMMMSAIDVLQQSMGAPVIIGGLRGAVDVRGAAHGVSKGSRPGPLRALQDQLITCFRRSLWHM